MEKENAPLLKMLLPKGRIFDSVAGILAEASILRESSGRGYTPRSCDPELQAKMMKPQNIAQLVEIGSHDVGFTGLDWMTETGADVEEIMDLGFDPVEIVSAAPCSSTKRDLGSRRIIAASEYERITRTYLEKEGFDFFFIRTYGATEAFPPQDADLIVDNMASGRTLKENGLEIVDRLFSSSTRFIANKDSLRDPCKREKIGEIEMLIKAMLDARERVMLEMNVPLDKMEEVVRALPCMRAPTVSPLYKDKGYAVKAAVRKGETVKLLPLLKKLGATDILEYELNKVIA